MKNYRNEWKYACTQSELSVIEHGLSLVLSRDAHAGSDGRYRVRSLYFDDLNNACALDTLAGLRARYKYRIRYYDDSPESIRLERKEKLDGGGHKDSCPLTREEYDALICGDVSPMIYETSKPLLRRFCANILKRRFAPKLIVDYERIAFVEPISNVRITMDTNISASAECHRFLSGAYQRIPIMPKDTHILEVKFDAILPGYIRRTVDSWNLQQQSYSKYVQSFERLRSII